MECDSDGKFIVTKPPKTGGMVSVATCSEQMLYEVGDPQNYILPDVVCDFTQVHMEPVKGMDNIVMPIWTVLAMTTFVGYSDDDDDNDKL